MSQEVRRARRAGKVVLQLYREHTPYVAEAATRLGATCKEGCSHCCTLPATATVPEMVPVVEYLAGRNDWEQRRPALERELNHQLASFAGVNVLIEDERVAFSRRKLPCVFLKDSRCEIYALRPAVCRYHMVVSPPENCEHGPTNESLTLIDLRGLERDVAIKGAEVLGELSGGPIALAFVLAADLIGVKLSIDRSLIARVTRVRMKVAAPS